MFGHFVLGQLLENARQVRFSYVGLWTRFWQEKCKAKWEQGETNFLLQCYVLVGCRLAGQGKVNLLEVFDRTIGKQNSRVSWRGVFYGIARQVENEGVKAHRLVCCCKVLLYDRKRLRFWFLMLGQKMQKRTECHSWILKASFVLLVLTAKSLAKKMDCFWEWEVGPFAAVFSWQVVTTTSAVLCC